MLFRIYENWQVGRHKATIRRRNCRPRRSDAYNLSLGGRTLLLTVGSLVLLAPTATGFFHPSPVRPQSPATSPLPIFDVASIKPSKNPEGSSTWDSSPEAGSMRMQNQSLRALIRIAYGVRDDQISGGPKWLDSDRYNIDAKAVGAAKDPQLLLMLRSLLVDRFKLLIHKDSRPFSGFSLVVGKGGLKIKSVQPGQNNQLNTRGGHMLAKGVSMAKLAQTLAILTGYPVADETHVSDVFDFNLDWAPDSSRLTVDDQAALVDQSTGESLFSALQYQLGLKLEARKIPTEFVVIDHAE